MISKIEIETVPHESQRYDTIGDWTIDGDKLTIKVSDSGNWRVNACVAMHELAESLMCTANGVTQEQVDEFDMGAGKELDEPGESPDAPYCVEHMNANIIEKFMQQALKLSDAEYEKILDRFYK